MKSLKISRAARALVSCASVAALSVQTAAYGQEAQADDEIVVTGTNIRGQDYSSPAPAEVLGLDDIRNSGVPTVTDLLTRLSVNTGSEFNTFAFSQNNTRGTAQVNLRGLGLGATLVLMNGRRLPKNASFADDGGAFVDINTIPLPLIKRVEVVKSGSSAIYGSDAVAGVVNFITRSDFEGLELTGDYQVSTQGAQEDISVSALAGWGDERTHVTLAATYFDRGELRFSERDFIQQSTELENIGRPGSFVLLAPPTRAPFIGLPPNTPIPDPNCAAAGGVPPAGPTGFCLTDSRPFQSLVSDEQRIAAYADVRHSFSEALEVFAEFNYARNESAGVTLPSLPGVAASAIVPPTNPFNPFGAPALFVGRPLGADVGLAENNSTSETFRIATGLAYSLSEDWRIDASYVYGQNDFENVFNDILTANLSAALNGAGPTPGQFFNLFGSSFTTPGAQNSQTLVDFVSIRPSVEFESSIHVVDAAISGSLFTLPGGDLGVAGGFQYRRDEAGFDSSDELNAPRGTLLFFPPVADFPNAATDVYAGFVEIGAPILDSVDLQLALRYENYGGRIGDTLDPKASLRWQLFDGFSVRASAGTSFRAPTPLQLGGSTTQVTPITNPCTGQRSAAAVVTAGNADLSPEDSTSYGAGVVFDRGGFRASIDFYRYDYEDVITRGDPQAIASAAVCTTIAPGRRVPIGPGVVLNPTSGQIAQINTAFFNAGAIETDGVDFNVGYRFPLGPAGDLDVDVTATLITSFDIQETQGGPVIDGLDSRNALNFARSTPDFRLNANLIYDFDQHQIGVAVRHIDGYLDDLNGRAPIDSFTTFDMQYSYRFDNGLLGLGNETALTVGAINLTGQDPPFVNDRGSYDPVVHDPRGRLFFVRARQSF